MATPRESLKTIAIAVLARAPLPGTVKTRLIASLGPLGTARLQAWLIRCAVATAVAARLGPVHLWCTPDECHSVFHDCERIDEVRLHRQPEGDLGERMRVALVPSETESAVLLIGTDCPTLTPEDLQYAAAQLAAGNHAVFLPAEDGGYVLVGMQAPSNALFTDLAWGTATVMKETRRRLRALGWRWSEPRTLWDVDRPDDLVRLAAFLPDRPWLSESLPADGTGDRRRWAGGS